MKIGHLRSIMTIWIFFFIVAVVGLLGPATEDTLYALLCLGGSGFVGFMAAFWVLEVGENSAQYEYRCYNLKHPVSTSRRVVCQI